MSKSQWVPIIVVRMLKDQVGSLAPYLVVSTTLEVLTAIPDPG